MRVVVRTWPALCALGAGLLHLAIAASAPWWAGIVLIVLGGAELAAAVGCLARTTIPVPRVVLTVTLIPVGLLAAWAVVTVAAQHHGATMSGHAMPQPSLLPFAVASGLDLVVAFVSARAMHRVARTASPVAGTGRTIAGILIGAALVAGVTVPALGATDAGHQASMHMQM